MKISAIISLSLLLAGAALSPASMAFSVTGSAVAVAGNSGNPVSSTPTVTTNIPGTISSGVITGATANSAHANLTVASSPLPFIALFAEGNDGAGFNGTFGFATATLTYTFAILPPPGVAPGALVELDIEGTTRGDVLATGSSSLIFNNAGTRLTLGAPDIVRTLRDNGSIGSRPTVDQPFNGPSSLVSIGWGADASAPQSISYADHFRYAATIAAGSTVSVKLQGLAQGGLTGTIRPTGTPTTGSANVYLDPYFSIDPLWDATHPGYSLVMEDGIGNAAPVPLPAALGSQLIAVFALAALRRRRPGAKVTLAASAKKLHY